MGRLGQWSIWTTCLVLFVCVSHIFAQECLPDVERVDCHPDPNVQATEERCLQRGCTWCREDVPGQNVPICFFPKNYGYKMVGEPVSTGHGFQVHLQRSTTYTLFGGDASELDVEVDFQSDYRLRIKISDDKPRWEVPLKIDPPATNLTNNPLYDVRFVNEPVFSFKVIRKNTGTVIFDSSLAGFTFADQYIQIGFKLPSRNVYGIGENEQTTFRHSFERRPRWPLWAKDQAPRLDANMYGVQPHYTVLEDDGNAHAVVIVNSNAQEFEMHPNPGIVYRTIGGILDMYFFLGPTPENTAQQYTEMVGRFPLPPFWALGFQLCRFGYNHIDTLRATVDRNIAAGIPLEVQYGDIDIMHENLDFTISDVYFPGLAEYVKELKTKGIKFMTILDPGISIGEPAGTYKPFDLGQEWDVWVKRADGTPATGWVWPKNPVYFADYSKNATREWWILLMKEFHEVLDFDAMWIDMNEPTTFSTGDWERGCEDNSLNSPPYLPPLAGGSLKEMTLCPDSVDSVGIQYNTHNLYAWYESEATYAAIKAAVGKRTFSLSRSTYLGSGRWLTHWLGDNHSRWSNLATSIIGTLQFNLFGMPFVGPDICGHNGDVTVEMCQRWQELGAFYPFSRNHNGNGYVEQDPAAFDGAIIESTKKALLVRYTLLPYLYTLLALHELHGNTVARAFWHEYPTDTIARGIDRQFLWGGGLAISPVLDEGQTQVTAYFPNGRWYDYYTGAEEPTRGNFTVLDAPLDHINLHVHGGHIIPTQEPAVNTEISRNNPFGLIVALDDFEKAHGSFYFDDGESFDPIQTQKYFMGHLTAENGKITMSVHHNDYADMGSKILDTIRLLGLSTPPRQISVNGQVHSNFTVKPSKEVFIQGLRLPANQDFVIEHT